MKLAAKAAERYETRFKYIVTAASKWRIKQVVVVDVINL
jgi:hypothetical protein